MMYVLTSGFLRNSTAVQYRTQWKTRFLPTAVVLSSPRGPSPPPARCFPEAASGLPVRLGAGQTPLELLLEPSQENESQALIDAE